MKGIYVSLTKGDLASYRVTLDAQGQELSREKLRPAARVRSGMPRIAEAAKTGQSGRAAAAAAATAQRRFSSPSNGTRSS